MKYPLFLSRDRKHAERPRHRVERDIINDGVQNHVGIARKEHFHDRDPHKTHVPEIGTCHACPPRRLFLRFAKYQLGNKVHKKLKHHREQQHPAEIDEHRRLKFLVEKGRHH